MKQSSTSNATLIAFGAIVMLLGAIGIVLVTGNDGQSNTAKQGAQVEANHDAQSREATAGIQSTTIPEPESAADEKLFPVPPEDKHVTREEMLQRENDILGVIEKLQKQTREFGEELKRFQKEVLALKSELRSRSAPEPEGTLK